MAFFYIIVKIVLFIPDFSRALFLQDEQQQNYSELRVKCLYRRASVFYEQRKYNATIKDLLGILIQDPQIVYPRILLGKTLKILGELEKAEEQILFAIFLENDQSSYYAELGDIRYQMGDKNKIRSAITGKYLFVIYLFFEYFIISFEEFFYF